MNFSAENDGEFLYQFYERQMLIMLIGFVSWK